MQFAVLVSAADPETVVYVAIEIHEVSGETIGLERELVFHPACGGDGAEGEQVVGHRCYFWVVNICFGGLNNLISGIPW